MELNYDWNVFQSMFYAKKRVLQPSEKGPIYLVVEERIVVAAFAESENLSRWIGATYDELVAEYPKRDLVLYDRAKVDQLMNSATELPHFLDQVGYFQSEPKPHVIGKNASRFNHLSQGKHRHFVLQLIQSGWQRMFPSNYGVYIQVVDTPSKPTASQQSSSSKGLKKVLMEDSGSGVKQIFLLVKRGRVHSFHKPDLSGMIRERRKFTTDQVKFLSEKYAVPVQGIFMTQAEWSEWSEMPNPWALSFKAVKADRSKLVPFRWFLAPLIGFKAYFKK